MRIGIDIDGTLNDYYPLLINEGIKWQLKNKVSPIIFNDRAWEFEKVFTLSEENTFNMLKDIQRHVLQNCNIRDAASNVTHQLAKDGHYICIITARTPNQPYYKNKLDYDTFLWLEKHNIKYHDVIFGSFDKAKVCLDYKIDIMVDDLDHNVKNVAKHIPTLHFQNTYNNVLSHPNITPVYSWYDVYLKINQLEN